jgi:hypothetical protein
MKWRIKMEKYVNKKMEKIKGENEGEWETEK